MIHSGADIKVALPHFYPDRSVLKLLVEALQANGDKVAMVEGHTGNSARFSDILQQSTSIAAGLCSAGVTEGDLAVMCCDKSILSYSLLLGIMFTGATAVLVYPQRSGEIHHCTKNHTVKAVFFDTTYLEGVTRSLKSMTPAPSLVATVDANDGVLSSLMSTSKNFRLFEVEHVRSHFPLVVFTSGSSGDPKGVPVCDFTLQRFSHSFNDDYVDSYLLMSPLAWITSTIFLVCSIRKGYSLVLTNSLEPKTNLQLIQKYKIHGWFMSASVMNIYLKEACATEVDLTSLKVVRYGGEVIKRRVAEAFIDKVLKGKIGVQSVYGMTEVGVLTTWKNCDLLDFTKANSSGYLAPGVQIKVVNDAGELLGPGSAGDLWVKSASLMSRYWGRPELNRKLFDKGGFFRTGDAGYFDKDGFLYVTGRVADLITSKGTKVIVSEAEDILMSHPAVLEAAIVANAKETDLPRLVAFVVKSPNCNVTGNELKDLVENQCGDAVVLQDIQFISKLPRNSNKVQRRQLQDMLN